MDLEDQQLSLRKADIDQRLGVIEERDKQLDSLVENERELLELKLHEYKRLDSLFDKGLVALRGLEISHSEYLQQQNSLENLVLRKNENLSDKINLIQELTYYEVEIKRSTLNLETELSILSEEIITTQARANNKTLAPVAGQIGSINTKLGDYASAQQAAMLVIPEGAELQVELFVSTSAVGFLKPGQDVAI